MQNIKPLPTNQGNFEYSDHTLITLEKYLSAERLAAYYDLADRDKVRAIKLYEHNTECSEALYGVIQGFEIALRNAIHNEMVSALGANWYERIKLQQYDKDLVSKAKKKIRRKKRAIGPSRVIAELTFGFWVNLFAAHYEKALWVKHLHLICLPKMKRSNLYNRLLYIRALRNRIAHHERIVGNRDLPKDYQDVLDAIGWISPGIQSWVRHTNCFQARWDKELGVDNRAPVEEKAVFILEAPAGIETNLATD